MKTAIDVLKNHLNELHYQVKDIEEEIQIQKRLLEALNEKKRVRLETQEELMTAITTLEEKV